MRKPTVLIVDDEPDVVTMLQRSLVLEGFDVLCAYDGISALDIAEVDKPDIVLLDIMMPMMSGYEVCRQLKSNDETKHIPILCVTSAHSADIRRGSMDAGAQDLLVKPFLTEELIARIRRHITEAAAGTGEPAEPPAERAANDNP